ncbi:MAG TPA: hypothetical protein EYP10_11910 [Armatimonadetes bacterium]|nr:hypothetical protein [Armatimonadota bacterium]
MIKLRPGGAITGEVLTQSGKPVANARIFCKRIEPFSSSTMWALTNTDGRFSLSGLVHGLYIVKAIMRSDSSLHYSQTVCRVKANMSIHLQLRLRGVGDVKPTKQESLSSAGLLVGRVLLPGGKASGAYARIYAVRLSDNMQEAGVTPIHYLTRQRRAVRSLPPWLRSYTEPIGIADEHGKFNIALPAGDYLISAWLPGYARTELDQIVKVTDGGKRYVTINLCEGGAIAGRIVCIDDANNLMPRCLRVQLLRYCKVNAQRQQRSMTSPSNQRWRASLPVHTFLTQSDGAFSISHLMPGTYTIAINDRAHLYYIGKVTVRNGEVLNGLKWTFRPIGGRIHGTVRAAKHRKPIRNATIMLYRNLRWIATATSSSNGTYAFEGLPHGTYTLHCYANGYANVTIMDITLDNEANEREVNIELWRGGSIYGKVVNEIGEPLKGLLVTTATEMHAIAPSGPTLRSTITDKDGCFTLPSLSPGEYVLTIWNCNGQLMHTNKISIRDGSTVRMPPIQFKGLKQWTISEGFVEIP